MLFIEGNALAKKKIFFLLGFFEHAHMEEGVLEQNPGLFIGPQQQSTSQ